jgi:hypothetical protein
LRNSTPVRLTYEPRGRCYVFRQQLVPPKVQSALVEQGTDYVCETFRGEPYLPSDFMGEPRSGAAVRAG